MLVVGPVGAESGGARVSVGGFDVSGVEVVVLASFDAGGGVSLWSAEGSRWGTQGHQIDLGAAGSDTTVTAADNITTRSHEIHIARAPSFDDTALSALATAGISGGDRSANPAPRTVCVPADADATLASFELSEGSLSPAFNPSVIAYTTSVPAHTGSATVTAEPTDPAASVDISASDTNPIAPGHQVDLAAAPNAETHGTTTIEAQVTGTDGCPGDTYTITVTRPPATVFGRSRGEIIDTIDLFDIGIVWPRDIWSDGQTMWVGNAYAETDWWSEPGVEGLPVDGLYAVDLATKTAVPARTINNIAHSTNDAKYPTSAWSDGTTLWTLCRCGWIMAYDLDTLERTEDRDYKVFFRDGTGYADYFGMWSDGTTLWVSNADRNNSGIRAIDLATGAPVEDKYIEMYSSGQHSGANGMWSDGKTIWVVHRTSHQARAFDIESGDRQRHLEIDLRNSGMARPTGIWSDGGVMWFSDQGKIRVDQQFGIYGTGEIGHDALVAYYLPTKAALSNLTLGHHRVNGFETWRTNYSAAFSAGTTSVTVGADAYHPDATITILPADSDANTEGHQVSLEPGANTVTVTAGTYNHTMTYTLTVARAGDSLVLTDSNDRSTAELTVMVSDVRSGDTVHLRYKKSSDSQWTVVAPQPAASSVTFELTGLDAGTSYDVQAALSAGFSAAAEVSFTTERDASIASVSASVSGRSTASVTVMVEGFQSGDRVFLRYRASGGGWSSTSPMVAASSVAFELTGLDAGTSYDVQAALSAGFASPHDGTFVTLDTPAPQPPPAPPAGFVGGSPGGGGGGSPGGGGEPEPAEPPVASSARFVDVVAGSYYQSAVGWMVDNEVTVGCEADRFCPHQTATRAHFVTFLWRAAGRPGASVSGVGRFSDVGESSYFEPAVAWAVEVGVTVGCGDGSRFCPHRRVTRGEVAAFLHRFARAEHAASAASFDDVDRDDYFFEAVEWMVANAITNGCDQRRFCPSRPATRAHVAAFLHRYYTQRLGVSDPGGATSGAGGSSSVFSRTGLYGDARSALAAAGISSNRSGGDGSANPAPRTVFSSRVQTR